MAERPHASHVKGCDNSKLAINPAESAGNPADCRTAPCPTRGLTPADERVLERLRRAPQGISAATIAKAALGDRARRLSVEALTATGLAIAARLCGQQMITPTRANNFKIVPRKEDQL